VSDHHIPEIPDTNSTDFDLIPEPTKDTLLISVFF